MPILAFHGGPKDPEVPYQNGAVGLSLPGVKVRGTQLNMGDWARLDTCRPRAVTSPIDAECTFQ
jgi:poly(3-hydroxybutyrate) depolymerase